MRNAITGVNIDELTIPTGIYDLGYVNGNVLGTFPTTNSFYGVFIQFNGNFKVQMIIGTEIGVTINDIYVRRYVASTSSWTPWTKK